MPNEVYLRTRAGLSAMVSSRAADRILLGALTGRGYSPEDVDRRQMRTALLGPVLEELESVLPRRGLKRNLESLANSLRSEDTVVGSDEAPRALQTGTIPSTAPAAVAVALPPVEVSAPTAATDLATVAEPAPGPGPDPIPERGAESGAVADAGTHLRVTPTIEQLLTDDQLERVVGRFATIEHVQLVAAIRADSSVPVSRGQGPDLSLLARLCRLSLSLLARGGVLRSLHLGHSNGQLFLFPIGPDLLVIFGAVDLNLGAVTTAFTALALEEEL